MENPECSEPFNYINAEIDRRDDGDVRILNEFQTFCEQKIRWGLLTP